MDKNMKRKQFHLTIAEEKIIYEMAKKNNISEAEVVRMAIREFGMKQANQSNSLIEMANAAEANQLNIYPNLSEDHDSFLSGESKEKDD